jgi:hypothetical protein
MVVIGREYIDGAARATRSRNITTRACPTWTPDAVARGTETMLHIITVSSAAATLKVPRREPRDLQAVSPERVTR